MKTQLDTDIDWDDFCNNDYEDDINNKIEQSDSNNSEKLNRHIFSIRIKLFF